MRGHWQQSGGTLQLKCFECFQGEIIYSPPPPFLHFWPKNILRHHAAGTLYAHPFYHARKKSTKINFFGPETAGWGGGLPPEGVGVEKFVPSLESLSSLGFEERNLGYPGNSVGMSRTPGGVQKVCAKKVRAHFSFPILYAPTTGRVFSGMGEWGSKKLAP